jgi:transcriptional regulator with XRE-family HTH domain
MSAAEARERAGLTIQTAARRARVCTAYLRQVERGGAPYNLARRLSAIYDCPIDIFLGGPRTQATSDGRSRSRPSTPRA